MQLDLREYIKANANELRQVILSELRSREPHQEYTGAEQKKGEPTMKVSCRGFNGELVKLERVHREYHEPYNLCSGYSITIRDVDKKVTYSLECVQFDEIKFLGGAVSFGE